MANPEMVEKLREALERDDPSRWYIYFENLRKETGTWQRLASQHNGDAILEMRAENLHKKNTDLTNADLSGKVFNSRLYSDTKYKHRIAVPETWQDEGMYINTDANDDYYFSGLDMTGTSLENAILRGCTFSSTNLSHVKAKGAVFAGCPFHGDIGCNFNNADLSGAKFHHCGFRDTRFLHADLSGAEFSDCNFAGDYLRDHPSRHAFFGANLKGAKFHNCDLSETGITKEQLEQCTSIEGCVLPKTLETARMEIELKMPDSQFSKELADLKKARARTRGFERPTDPTDNFGRTPAGRGK